MNWPFDRNDVFENLTFSDKYISDKPRASKVMFRTNEQTSSFTKEKSNCIHNSNDEPHSHGKLTFHLIEGLDGKAADPDNGLITIENLREYIDKQMQQENRQIHGIYYYISIGSIEDIRIAISQKEFNAKISTLIKAGENSLINHKNDFIDIKNISEGTKKVNELIRLDPKNKEIPRLQGLIDNALEMYKQPTTNWLLDNEKLAKQKINEIRDNFYDIELPDLVWSLSFNKLFTLPDYYIEALYFIFLEVIQNTKFKTTKDKRLGILTSKLREVFDSKIKV